MSAVPPWLHPVLQTPYTNLVLIIALAAYWLIPGPPSEPKAFFDLLGNLFRHQNLAHLGLNLFVIAYCGHYCESARGGPFMLGVALGSLILGSIMEYLLIDGRFVGLSAGAYGLAAWVTLHQVGISLIKLTLIALSFALIIAIGYVDNAVVAHATGAITGGVIAMFGSLFKKKKPQVPPPAPNQQSGGDEPYHLRPMVEDDLPRVIEIIAETDEDDAEEAEENLNEREGKGMYVLEERGRIIGMTGYSLASDIPGIGWLSWTYLDPAHQGQGAGKFMVNRLLDIMDTDNVRKLFIASSDYQEDGEMIYAAAHAFYQSMGAEKELQIDDYHDQGEAMILFGLENKRFNLTPQQPIPAAGVRFSGIHPADESEDGYELQWESTPDMEGVEGLKEALSEARKKQARILMAALPEDISDLAAATLDHAGFRFKGKLRDFYDKGVAQAYWTLKNP